MQGLLGEVWGPGLARGAHGNQAHPRFRPTPCFLGCGIFPFKLLPGLEFYFLNLSNELVFSR